MAKKKSEQFKLPREIEESHAQHSALSDAAHKIFGRFHTVSAWIKDDFGGELFYVYRVPNEETPLEIKGGLTKNDLKAIGKVLPEARQEFIDKLSEALSDALKELKFEVLQPLDKYPPLLRQDFTPFRRFEPEPVTLQYRLEDGTIERNTLAVRRRGGSEPNVEATDEQCINVAKCYSEILKLWQGVGNLKKAKSNWREHVKLDEPNIPDDLLARLEDLDPYTSKPSAIALEHAARLCGIKTKGCSESTLKRLRTRGKTLLGVSQP